MHFNSELLIKRRVLLEAAWAAATEFRVFNVIRETAGVGAEHPAPRQAQVGGGSSWDRHPEWCEACRKCPGTQPGLEMVGQFPSWLTRLLSIWGSRECGWQPSASVHLSLVLPWTIVLSLQAVRPCVFVLVSVPLAHCRVSMGEESGRLYPSVLFCCFWYAECLEISPCSISNLLHFSMIQADVWCLVESCWEVKLWFFLMSGWCLNNMAQSSRSQSTFEFALLRLHGRHASCVAITMSQETTINLCIVFYWLCNTGNLIWEP